MNLRSYPIILLLIFVFSNALLSQNIIYSSDKNENQVDESNNINQLNSENKNLSSDSKITYKVDLGTNFSSSSFANAVSLYTAPQLKYRLSPKLNISTGILVVNTTVSGYYLSEKDKRNNFTQGYLFAGVDYKATEKLRISGEILYGMNKSPYAAYNNRQNSDYYLRFSAEYKITNNLSVGLQVINQNMAYPAYGDPFNRNPFGSYYNPYNPFSRF